MTSRATLVLAIGLVFWPLATARAGPSADASAAYDRAFDRLGDGEDAAAAAAFAEVAARWPQSDRAPGALYAAARLYEEKLGDPRRAAELYDRLVTTYPASRLARSAQARLADLAPLVGSDPDAARATATLRDLLARGSELPPGDAMARARALVRGHPHWDGVPRALLFIAGLESRAGNKTAALATYLRVARDYPHGEHLFAALSGAGDMAIALSRFDLAEGCFARILAVAADPGQRRAAESGIRRARRQRFYARVAIAAMVIAVVALALLAGLLVRSGGSGKLALAALCRPPPEAMFLAPLTGLLMVAAHVGAPDIAVAVDIIAAAGILVTWLSGAGLAVARRRRRLRPSLILAHAILAAILVAAMIIVTLHETHLGFGA
ncbi:MAG TPA: tetratricopeptide repeat protein [Kofleriaceae bacterium]|nr:tetratricopeptide repeat protein [Kofleriaceae bacterium]